MEFFEDLVHRIGSALGTEIRLNTEGGREIFTSEDRSIQITRGCYIDGVKEIAKIIGAEELLPDDPSLPSFAINAINALIPVIGKPERVFYEKRKKILQIPVPNKLTLTLV